MDVHGAGAQRCDLKCGNPATLPQGRGPQGDVMRIYNLARCVRGGTAELRSVGPTVVMSDSLARPDAPDAPRPQHGQGPMSGAHFVRRIDRDGNGKVSRNEFDGPAHHFTHLDRNRDGYLTEDEAPTGPPPAHRRSRRSW
jgi:hypothetical protein